MKEIKSDIPDRIVNKIAESLIEAGFKDREGTYKYARISLHEYVAFIEFAGGKVIWDEDKEGELKWGR